MAFRDANQNVYRCITATLSLIFLIAIPSYAAGLFQPYINEGQNEPVCGAALKYYSDAYHSSVQALEPLSGEVIKRPKFEMVDSFASVGTVTKADITIDGQEKSLVYYRRAHSWRGDVFSGYLVSADQIPVLLEQIKQGAQVTIKPFYPNGGDEAWRKEIPFLYEGDWYMDETEPAFDANQGVRNIFRLSAGGEAAKVCEIKIFEQFDARNNLHSSSLPFFSAYVRSMEKIMLSSGSCGTSHPEVGAKASGQLFVSMSVSRPWGLDFKPGRFDPPKKLLNEHFDQWRYNDIWSYRERDVLDNLKVDAHNELTQYFQSRFAYSESAASSLAESILKEMNIRYYSLASFDKAGVDFSSYQQLVNGTLMDWQPFSNRINSEDEIIIFPEFSLLVDNPYLIEKLPKDTKVERYQTIYGKDLLMAAAHMNNYDSVKYLVEKGWSVEHTTTKEDGMCWEGPDRVNRSALTYAVENASPYLISYLIKSGANSEILDSAGNGLDFYLKKNPRFADQEKALGLMAVLNKYTDVGKISPSYSCDEKLNKIEMAICKSEGLSIYDIEMRDAYRKALSKSKQEAFLKKSQIKWIVERNKNCSQYINELQLNACIARSTRARIRYLESVSGTL